MPKDPKDPRSTQRKRARKVLERVGREFKCACPGCKGCKKFDEGCGYVPTVQSRSDSLDANHVNKNIYDNDPVNLEYLCRPCHKNEDSKTAKGVSKIEDEHGYGSYY